MSHQEIERLLSREEVERSAASKATDADVRDAYFMLAERYADLAWSLNENDEDLPPIRSGLWH